MEEFIAHDWCGWKQQYGRFTHMPSGDSLICQAWMGQSDWNMAQLGWFLKYPGLTVYNCVGAYTTDAPSMGTVNEIIIRLETRIGVDHGR